MGLVPMMMAPAPTVSMLEAYQVTSDLLCPSVPDSPLVQEFEGAVSSIASFFIVPVAPSGHVIELPDQHHSLYCPGSRLRS